MYVLFTLMQLTPLKCYFHFWVTIFKSCVQFSYKILLTMDHLFISLISGVVREGFFLKKIFENVFSKIDNIPLWSMRILIVYEYSLFVEACYLRTEPLKYHRETLKFIQYLITFLFFIQITCYMNIFFGLKFLLAKRTTQESSTDIQEHTKLIYIFIFKQLTFNIFDFCLKVIILSFYDLSQCS